jgi:DNA-binding Lrp family transcriptional regulator
MENKTEQFLMVPYTILQNKELKDSDKMTLALIYSFHNNNKEVYISNNKLGYMLGVSRTTASERVTKLETLGYIKCERVMVNGKERRTIVPLKMVGEPKPLVGTPNLLVGTPNSTSRYSDTSLVGGVGSIIYPILNKELNKLPHNELNNEISVEEQLQEVNYLISENNFPTNESRGKAFMLREKLLKELKQLITK